MSEYFTYETLSNWINPNYIPIISTFALIVIAYRSFSSDVFPITGRRVLITGCDTGLGRDLAIELSQAGCQVFAGCLTTEGVSQYDQSNNQTVNQSIKSPPINNGLIIPLLLDVTSRASVDEASLLIAPYCAGGLDALINNAGIYQSFVCEMTPLSVYERVMSVNFIGAVRVTQQFAPLIRQSGGRIIFIGSFTGRASSWGISAYAASKHALEAFVESLRAELTPFDVSVSMIRASSMNTPMARGLTESLQNMIKGTIEQPIDTSRKSSNQPSNQPTKQTASIQSNDNTINCRVIEDYGTDYLSTIGGIRWVLQTLAQPTSKTVDAVKHALMARSPNNVYVVGFEAFAVTYLWPICPLPTRWINWMIDCIVGVPTPHSMSVKKEQKPVFRSVSRSDLDD